MNNHEAKLSEHLAKLHCSPSTLPASRVPQSRDFLSGDEVFEIDGCLLFADHAGTTALFDKYESKIGLWVLRAYLYCATAVIRNYGGTVSAFEGDAVMGAFVGNDKENRAVKTAFGIEWLVRNVIQKKYMEIHPNYSHNIRHAVGIDVSNLLVAKTGVWNDNDIVWAGSAANHSANYTRIYSDEYSTHISHAVYQRLDPGLIRSSDLEYWDVNNFDNCSSKIHSSSVAIPVEWKGENS